MNPKIAFESECRSRIDVFCATYPQYRPLAAMAGKVLTMLLGSGEALPGKPGGWAGGIIHALTCTGCGVPGVLNTELEKAFGASIGTIRKRATRVTNLFNIRG